MHLPRKTLFFPGMVVLALILVFSAGTESLAAFLTAERPRDEAFRTGLKKELSCLNISIETSASDLREILDRKVPRELYKGSTKTRGLTADILRNGPIAVSAADNYIYLSIPVTISLGYGVFETPAVTARLKFRVNASVARDWKINAEVYYMGLSDLLADQVGIGPLSIKPRSIVEGLVLPLQRSLSELATRKLNEKFQIRAQVARVWSTAQKPILLDKSYSAWLKVTPREVMVYPLYARNNQVR